MPLLLTLHGAPMSGTNSKQRLKFNKRVVMLPSARAVEWQHAMVSQLREKYRAPAITGPVALTLTFYRVRRAGDLDNFAKPVLDALQKAGVIANDSQVGELHLYRQWDKANPRTEIVLTELAA